MLAVVEALQSVGVKDVSLVKTPTQELVFLVRRQGEDVVVVPVKRGKKPCKNLGDLTRNEWIAAGREAYNDVHPPQLAEGRFIIIEGDGISGYSHYGPFSSKDTAIDWAVEALPVPANNWYVIELDDQGGHVCA